MRSLRLTICCGLLVISAAVTVSANTATVAKVHPGCVLELDGGWQTRILGVDIEGPETSNGRKALDFCRVVLEGRLIKLFTWTTDNTAAGIVFGPDGVAFARVLYGDRLATDLAVELLSRGLATVDEKHLPVELKHYSEIGPGPGRTQPD